MLYHEPNPTGDPPSFIAAGLTGAYAWELPGNMGMSGRVAWCES